MVTPHLLVFGTIRMILTKTRLILDHLFDEIVYRLVIREGL